jgi:hypothetical protein
MRPHRKLLAGLFLLLATICCYQIAFSLGSSLAAFNDRSSDGQTIQSDILDPPENLLANPVSGNTTIPMSWDASPDASYIEGYRVYRRQGAGAWTEVFEGPGLTHGHDVGLLTIGLNYEFTVRAYFENWESVNSNLIECSTPDGVAYTCDNTP